jgi:two-component sensor histidine kinase
MDGIACTTLAAASPAPLPFRIPAGQRIPPLALALDDQSPGRARRHTVTRALQLGATPDQAHDAALIACELVTNAIEASLTPTGPSRRVPVKLWVSDAGACVLIEVHDYASGIPALAHVADGAEDGRGLRLVDALSEEWGWCPLSEGCKRVHALVPKATQA